MAAWWPRGGRGVVLTLASLCAVLCMLHRWLSDEPGERRLLPNVAQSLHDFYAHRKLRGAMLAARTVASFGSFPSPTAQRDANDTSATALRTCISDGSGLGLAGVAVRVASLASFTPNVESQAASFRVEATPATEASEGPSQRPATADGDGGVHPVAEAARPDQAAEACGAAVGHRAPPEPSSAATSAQGVSDQTPCVVSGETRPASVNGGAADTGGEDADASGSGAGVDTAAAAGSPPIDGAQVTHDDDTHPGGSAPIGAGAGDAQPRAIEATAGADGQSDGAGAGAVAAAHSGNGKADEAAPEPVTEAVLIDDGGAGRAAGHPALVVDRPKVAGATVLDATLAVA